MHGCKQVERGAQIVVIVAQRLRDRFAHGLEAGEVDDRIDRLRGKQALGRIRVAQVAALKQKRFACKCTKPVQNLRLAVDETVRNQNIIARFEKGEYGVGTDVPGAAGHKNQHGWRPPQIKVSCIISHAP